MANGAVPFKTAEGQAELSMRQRRVSHRQRTVLFLIDGNRSAAEVCPMALLRVRALFGEHIGLTRSPA